MTMKKRRNWILVAFGIAVLLVFVGIGAIVAVTAWFQQNLSMQQTTAGDAQSQFDSVRQQYPNRAPLLEMRDGKPAYSGNRPAAGPRAALETLHVMVWDDDEERLMSFSIPFWLLRMKSTPIQLSSYASGMDDNGVDLRPEDIEKYGAGIILDTASRSGERILLWAQ
jgi:hypothetical protein